MRFVLLAFLLLAGLPVPAADEMPAILLVANRDMADPFFGQSVVLVTHRAGPVPMGVILNKPTKVAVAAALKGLAKPPGEDRRVFFGGPVDADELVALFRCTKVPDDAIEALDGVCLSGSMGVMRAVVDRERAENVRVLHGYASWGPGQLEREIARGDWHLAKADAATIFEKNPGTLWRDLERRAAANTVRATPESIQTSLRP